MTVDWIEKVIHVEVLPPMGDLPEILSVTQCAELLRINRTTVFKWIKKGLLPARRLGAGAYVIGAEDLRDFCSTKRPTVEEYPAGFVAYTTAIIKGKQARVRVWMP